ncbi:hypothetical protein Tco_0028821, partial [Tanacetum coccineum]
KRKAEVQEAAQFYTEEDWDTIRAKLEENVELTKSLQGENMSSDDFAKKDGGHDKSKKELEQESSKKQKIAVKDVPVIEEKVKVVKKEEPINRTGKKKKQKVRKGTHADKTAKHEAEEDMEALVKGNDTDSSSDSSKSSDEEITPANDRLSKADGYHAVPFYNRELPNPKSSDISFAEIKLEDWNSDDEDDVSEVNTVS